MIDRMQVSRNDGNPFGISDAISAAQHGITSKVPALMILVELIGSSFSDRLMQVIFQIALFYYGVFTLILGWKKIFLSILERVFFN